MKRAIQTAKDADVSSKRLKRGSQEPQTRNNIPLAKDLELLSLFDLSDPGLSSSESISARFDELSEVLLRECRIVWRDVQDKREEYEILELELYLASGDHLDPFTHGAEDMLRTSVGGQWQFHKAPRRALGPTTAKPKASVQTLAGGYRGGTRKGLDISLGMSSHEVTPHTGLTSRYFPPAAAPAPAPVPTKLHGGILLRSIRRISDSHVISGPSLLVDELLRINQATNIADLVQNKWMGDLSIFPSDASGASSRLSICRTASVHGSATQVQAPKIYRSPRIGLDLSNTSVKLDPSDLRIRFVASPYRAFIFPHLLTANGRGHTFLGVLQDLEHTITGEKALVEALSSTLALKSATVVNYLSIYRRALEAEDLRHFVGSAGKGAGSSPAAMLRMTAAVHRYLQQTKTDN